MSTMAMVPSPEMSPVMGAPHRLDRTHSQTPPPQQLSKRDKRRTQLLDRLQDVQNSFSANKDQHYRQQLQAIQADTNLILRADLYSTHPLDDRDGDLVETVQRAAAIFPKGPTELNQRNITQIGGHFYSDFAAEVNTACEERDANLTRHQESHQKSIESLKTTNAFMIKLATEEHISLSTSLRDRLINSISGRKSRILKEKDDLFNIAESNAIHMHPNQFGINNIPSSPGPLQPKRATRQRREVEDIAGFPDSHKRKRKAVDDTGSPVPSKRLVENGFSTPLWTTEQVSKAINKSNGNPAYSVEKLFTEKELTLAYNTAAQAANNYILSHKVQPESQSPQNGPGDSDLQDGDNAAEVEADNDESGSPPSAPLMGRQPSTHATRSTRGTANIISAHGVEGLTDLTTPANFQIFSSILPKIPTTSAPKKDGRDGKDSPFRATDDEVYNDLKRIQYCKRANEANDDKGFSLNKLDNNDRELLAAAVAMPGKYQAFISKSQIKKSARSRDVGVGAIPMSRQSSRSEMGGVAMSRQGTGEGSSMGRRRGRQ